MADEFDVEVNDLTTDEPAAAEAELAEPPSAQAVSARKPGRVAQIAVNIGQSLSRLTLPQWNLRTFLYSLIVLILLVLLVGNLTAVRIDLFGWRLDVPKPILFLIGFLLGVGLHWWWRIHAERRDAGGPAEKQSDSEN